MYLQWISIWLDDWVLREEKYKFVWKAKRKINTKITNFHISHSPTLRDFASLALSRTRSRLPVKYIVILHPARRKRNIYNNKLEYKSICVM